MKAPKKEIKMKIGMFSLAFKRYDNFRSQIIYLLFDILPYYYSILLCHEEGNMTLIVGKQVLLFFVKSLLQAINDTKTF